MKAILLAIFLVVSVDCFAQSTLKEQLEYQKKTGVGLLITGGSFAHASAVMFYNAIEKPKCSRYTTTDYVCAGSVFAGTAIPCLVVGAVHLGKYNSNSGQYNFNLTLKTNGSNCTAVLNF